MTTLRLEVPFELRELEDGDGRTITGRLLPYGETVEVAGGRESFEPGVFAGVDPDAVVLLYQHDRAQPIGRMTGLTEEPDGAYGEFRVGDTPRIRELLSLTKDRIIRGLSVGFIPGQSTNRGGVRIHQKATLMEVSLVTFPAYGGAEVLATREEEKHMETTETVEMEEAVPAAVDLTPLETRMDAHALQLRELRNEVANIIPGAAPAEQAITLEEAFVLATLDVARNRTENRALADVIGTEPGNASGLIHDTFATEVIGLLNMTRPFISAAGSYPFPASGYGVTFPKITQGPLVAKRGAEKTLIPTREVLIDDGRYAMEWFAGGVDVALELISQSSPDAVAVINEAMRDEYARATEDEFVTDVEAAATDGGAVLSFATWAAFGAEIIGTSAAIRTATGQPGNRLALTTASWTSLVGLLNPSQPAALPGPGAPDFTAESVDLRGIVAFHSPESTVDVQFNTKALRIAEKPPLEVTATNVALMGRDIGILGATIALPLYPAGIVKHAVVVGTTAAKK